jgi:large subunit ribosomal protein L1
MVEKEAVEGKDSLSQTDKAVKPAKGKDSLSQTDKAVKPERSKKIEQPQPKEDTEGQNKDKGTETTEPEKEAKELTLIESIKLARDNSKQRKFEQTWDFIINLKGLDLKKPENRFSAEMPLPKGRGKQPKIAVFADLMAPQAKEFADLVITKNEIEALIKDKKKMKRIANEHDFFFGEATLMPMIGKGLGTVLGPRGKVPKPMPPKGNIEPLLKASRRMVRIALKETPVIYVRVGSEKMVDQDIADNVQAVHNFVKEKLPKGKNNIKSMLIKLTMGKPVKIAMK